MRTSSRKPRNLRISQNHPCIFGGQTKGIVHSQFDPKIQTAWKEHFGCPAPFGNLRLLFRQEHCRRINPYGSDSCPYEEYECAYAFYLCAIGTVSSARDRRTASGYFRAIAKTTGMKRAEDKPLMRYRRETQLDPTQAPRRSSDTGDLRSGDEARQLGGVQPDREDVPVRSRFSVPDRIGTLLGSLDLGPRPGPADDGEESTE